MKNASKHPLYNCWNSMKNRCSNPKHASYSHYGGRGITVCDEWLGKDGFDMFLYHMGNKPSPEHSIDRLDNDYIYCPENCRWATQKEQNSNKRPPANALGYTWHKPKQKWQTRININGVTRTLGYYLTEAEARAAYLVARKVLCYTV